MNTPTIYTATPADLSPPVQTDSFCVDLVLATDYQKLKESLEKAEQYSKERDEENQDLMLTIGRLRVEREGLEAIRAAAEKLVRCKGRHHSEQNYRALAALFGVTTPDLPPINSDNANAVKLPRAYNMLLRQKFFEHYSSQEAFKVKDMLEALTSAGIEWEFE
ncbi:TPA: hypothetical protein ACHSNL_001853 [Klebsiella variicola]